MRKESREDAMTTAVMINPYLNPVYVYATASIVGAYIPKDFDPTRYLAKLTIVAIIAIPTSNSKVLSAMPLSSTHLVKGV